MQKHRLGLTDIVVSHLGLGTVKFGRNQSVKYPHPFIIPEDYELENLLFLASELGINLLDTAPAYGNSEERLGKLLKNNRHDWIISTKVGEEFVDGQSTFDFSENAMIDSVERSLKRLGTDYLDIVLVHSNGDDEYLIEQKEVFNTLNYMKEIGKIRAFGMSTKTMNGGFLTIKHADLAMISLNSDNLSELAVIAYAEEQHKGIFVKKALGSGHLNPQHSLKLVSQEKGVSSIIIGTINPDHLRENVSIVNSVCDRYEYLTS